MNQYRRPPITKPDCLWNSYPAWPLRRHSAWPRNLSGRIFIWICFSGRWDASVWSWSVSRPLWRELAGEYSATTPDTGSVGCNKRSAAHCTSTFLPPHKQCNSLRSLHPTALGGATVASTNPARQAHFSSLHSPKLPWWQPFMCAVSHLSPSRPLTNLQKKLLSPVQAGRATAIRSQGNSC